MKLRQWHSGLWLALVVFLLASEQANAQTLLGFGTGSLQGGDLTDPENNGLPDADTNYNGTFFASVEPFFGGGEGAFNLFDNRVGGGNDKFCCNGGTINVGVNFNTPGALSAGKQFVLSRFNIASDNDVGTTRDPDIWAIQGSNDGSTWTNIFSYNNDGTSPFTFGGGSVDLKVLQYNGGGVDFATPAAYSQFRFTSSSYGSQNILGLSELEFFGDTQPLLTSSIADGSTIGFAPGLNNPATTQLTLSNTGTTNLSEIDLLSYSITGVDAALFDLVGFSPSLLGAHGTAAAGDGLLSDDSGNALNLETLDINFLGSPTAGDYSALLQIFAQDDNGNPLTLNFNLQAHVPEPATIAIWSLLGAGLVGFGVYRARRKA